MKHQPAARHSAFYWRDGYQQQIDWTNGKRAALSRIKTAKELVAGPLKSKLKTVLVGDLNSGPALPKAEDIPPYAAVAAAGFVPLRTKKLSCCFNDDLKSGKWDHNIDWIMAKPKVKLVRSWLMGTEKTAKGVYPADHGAVISTLRF